MSSSSRGQASKASGSATGARPKSKKRNTTIEIDVTPSRPSTSTSRSSLSPRSPKKKYFADPRRNPSISSAGSPRKRPKKKGKSLGKRLRETVLEEGDDWRQRLRQLEEKNRALEEKLQVKKLTLQSHKQQHKREIEELTGNFNTQSEREQEKHIKEKSKFEKELKSLRKRAEKAELDLIKAESIKTSQNTGAPEAFFQDILVNLKDFLDGQLQCSICNEIYVFPTSINCGHTYCEDCIEGWRKKQANATCPICRADVVMLSPNQVLDGFIEKFIDNFFPEDAKGQRAELVKERKTKKDARAQEPVLSAGTRRRILNLDSEDDTDDSWDGALAALAVEPGMNEPDVVDFSRFLW